MSSWENAKTPQDKKDGRAVEMHMEKMIDTVIMSVHSSILTTYLPMVRASQEKEDRGSWALDYDNVVQLWLQGGERSKTKNAKQRVSTKKLFLETIVSTLQNYNFEEKENHLIENEPVETKKEYTRLRNLLVADIQRCLSIVSEFDEYCDEMDKYVYEGRLQRLTPWIHKKSFADCKLSIHLQTKGITKEDAKTICKGLGASELAHLAYIDESDMSRSCIPASARTALTLAVRAYKESMKNHIAVRQRRDSTYIKGNAGLHVLLQQLQTMADDDAFRV